MTDSRSFYFDPSATGIRVFLGPTEAVLMDLAWEKKELTVKKALYFMGKRSDRAYTTVMTVLNRLVAKGLLARVKQGRSFVYSPTVSRRTFVQEKLSTVRACLKQNF